MAPSAAPPSPQEISRKLSVHSAPRSPKPPTTHSGPHSHSYGSESDPDVSILSPDSSSLSAHSAAVLAGAPTQHALSSIAERRSHSGGESDEDEEDEHDIEAAGVQAHTKDNTQESVDGVIRSGYLSKKGERRKNWKKRWFVLRHTHLALYKSSKEYELLRLLELRDVHSCIPCTLKNHDNTFGLVLADRTYYLQAKSAADLQAWVRAVQDAKDAMVGTSTQTSITSPIPIPPAGAARTQGHGHGHGHGHLKEPTPSPPAHSYGTSANAMTSSDSEDGAPSAQRMPSSSPSQRASLSPAKGPAGAKDPAKPVVSGYLMKCGSKRKNWRKRWFVLNGEKLLYSASHMDTKPHRQFNVADLLDALEYDLPAHRANPTLISPPAVPPPGNESDGSAGPYTFKVVTTKRALLLCAPSEEEEIRWLSAIRALIARRSGVGGESGTGMGTGTGAKEKERDAAAGAAGGGAGASGAGAVGLVGAGGLRGKVRRLSGSGSGHLAGATAAASHGAPAGEGASRA